MPNAIYAPSESPNAPAGRRKPIRRYGRLRRATMMAKYYARKSLRFPLGAGILLLMFLDGLLCLGTVLGLLFAVYNLLCGNFFKNGGLLWVVFAVVAGCAISAYGEVVLARILRRIIKEPQGHFLNPVRPEIHAVVPEEEVLVRASMPESKGILLRAAAAQPDAAPEMLLRAVNSDAGD